MSETNTKTNSSKISLDYDAKKVSAIIEEGKKKILGCKDLTVVVFLGKNGAGKTTICAGLVFGMLNIDKDGRLSPRKQKEGFTFPDIGVVGSGKACTKIPQAFPSGESESEFMLLDTMGLFDNNLDKENEIASYSLLFTALKMAANIKVVSVESHSVYVGGLSSINQMGEVWNKLINNPSVPILYVLNRFTPKAGKEAEKWNVFQTKRHIILHGEPDSDPESDSDSESDSDADSEQGSDCECDPKPNPEFNQKDLDDLDQKINDFAIKSIKKQLKTMEKAAKDISDGLNERRKEKEEALTLSLDDMNPEEKELLKQFGYLSLMRINFDKGNVAYFDPTSRVSINCLLECIKKLEPVRPGDLNLAELCGKMDEFKRKVMERIPDFTNVLTSEIFARKHNEAFTQARIKQLREAVEEEKRELEDVERNGLKGIRTEDARAYLSELQRKEKKIQEDLGTREKELEKAKIKIDVIEKGDPVVYQKYHMSLAQWRTNWLVECDIGFPISEVKEKLGAGLKNERTIERDYEKGKFQAKYTFGSFKKTFLSWVGWMNEAPEKENTGVIEIYVRPRDIPENKTTLELLRERVTDLERAIEEMKQGQEVVSAKLPQATRDLGKAESEEARIKRQKEELSLRIKDNEDSLSHLDYYLRFVQQMEGEFKKQEGTIRVYHLFFENMLSFDKEQQTPVIQNFMKLVDELNSIDDSYKPEEITPKLLSIEASNRRKSLGFGEDS